ncbi:MAG: c-type cytochrome [Halocynthiibacter sp.]
MIGAALVSIPLTVSPASADEIVSSIARGGQLYDKWYKVIKAPKPEETHAAWPASNTKKSGAATQRCKACHGWDLQGRDGAYSSGSYKTGIVGLTAMAGKPNEDVIAAIKDQTHGFAGKMDEQDYIDLANFVTKGQIDMDAAINRETKVANGDIAKGEEYYNTVCASCHGRNGKLPKELDEPIGALSTGNPWEILQKIMNGQPGEQMPAMRAFGVEVSTDILAYIQTLPKE